MADQTTRKTVTAIIPAYNEAARISGVLQVITSSSLFDEVIVADDGSTDGTDRVAQQFPVRLIRFETNQGKGQVMDEAVRQSRGDVIFFSDADVRGLRHDVLEDIVRPVLEGSTEMVIGMRNRKIYFLRFIFAIIPLLGGERALSRELWEKVPDRYKNRFMIEAALNFYARHYGKGFLFKVFPGLTQTIKEKKQGIITGFRNRIRMFYEVMYAQLLLQLIDTPKTVRSGRLAFTTVFTAIIGSLLGIVLLIASLTDPGTFVRDLFAQELAEDPDAPLVQLLLDIAANVSIDILVAVSIFVIGINLLILAASAGNLRYLLSRPAPVDRLE